MYLHFMLYVSPHCSVFERSTEPVQINETRHHPSQMKLEHTFGRLNTHFGPEVTGVKACNALEQQARITQLRW